MFKNKDLGVQTMLSNWIEIMRTGDLSPGRPMDSFSRWLLATRASVLTMTLTSVLIGGLLAQPTKPIQWLWWGLILVGVTLAHASNNLLNDYFDYQAGLDTPDYARAQYAPHPILGGLLSERSLLQGVAVAMGLQAAIALYLTWVHGPLVLLFALLGLAISVFYTAGPIRLKRIGLGELAVFVVWGPLMTGGTYFALTGSLPARVWAASLPYAFIVTTVLMGKHIDKIEMDAQRGIWTVPVLLGFARARRLTQALMILFYSLVVSLVLTHVLSSWVLLSFLSLPRLRAVLHTFNQPRPVEPPEDYSIWPLWYVAWAFILTRPIGFFFLVGLALSWILPLGW
jgi:1,4-dihydroxy-2-naphthoate octaprenyltransferase